jgi:hypothetical protein
MTTKDLAKDLCQRIEERAGSFASTDAKRVGNSPMRHAYRELSEAEKEKMTQIKDLGQAFTDLLHELGGTDPSGEQFGSRNLALSFGHIEDAVMRAVKHLTA